MNQSLAFVGLDVDGKAFHGHFVSDDGQQRLDFVCRADVGVLIKKLESFRAEGFELRICYEAAFPGLRICRDLRRAGFYCDAIAPSLIPQSPGNRVKTDRLDAQK